MGRTEMRQHRNSPHRYGPHRSVDTEMCAPKSSAPVKITDMGAAFFGKYQWQPPGEPKVPSITHVHRPISLNIETSEPYVGTHPRPRGGGVASSWGGGGVGEEKNAQN